MALLLRAKENLCSEKAARHTFSNSGRASSSRTPTKNKSISDPCISAYRRCCLSPPEAATTAATTAPPAAISLPSAASNTFCKQGNHWSSSCPTATLVTGSSARTVRFWRYELDAKTSSGSTGGSPTTLFLLCEPGGACVICCTTKSVSVSSGHWRARRYRSSIVSTERATSRVMVGRFDAGVTAEATADTTVSISPCITLQLRTLHASVQELF